MLLKHALTNVGPITNCSLRNVLRKVVGDTPAPNRVRTNRRWALRSYLLGDRLAGIGLTPVWALFSVLKGARIPIRILRECCPRRPPVLCREQRLTPVLVGHIWPAVAEPVVEDLEEPTRESDVSLTIKSVLDWRV